MINHKYSIGSLLPFGSGIFQIQILQRKKDGNLNTDNDKLFEHYVTNEQEFDKVFEIGKLICDNFNARMYINLNPKNAEFILWHMQETCTDRLKCKSYKPLGILSHSVAKSPGFGSKFWVIDIDIDFDKEHRNYILEELNKKEICDAIYSCRSDEKDIIKLISTTPNGYHIVTKPFNIADLPESYKNLRIMKNDLTLLYVP